LLRGDHAWPPGGKAHCRCPYESAPIKIHWFGYPLLDTQTRFHS
jgi:hypothetical protein